MYARQTLSANELRPFQCRPPPHRVGFLSTEACLAASLAAVNVRMQFDPHQSVVALLAKINETRLSVSRL